MLKLKLLVTTITHVENTCLFCDNKPNSSEHVIPEWILEKLPPAKITGFIGRHKNISCYEVTVNSVCRDCNGHWMSDIETLNKPIMGPMIDGKSAFLDNSEQNAIAKWAIKTAMVMDSLTVAPHRRLFFTQEERLAMRRSQQIPARTFIWLGRYLDTGIAAESGGCYYTLPPTNGRELYTFEVYKGFLSTFVLGSLAIQTFTLRAPTDYSYRSMNVTPAKGPWNELLCSIWPTNARIYWPPILGFDDRFISIKRLHGRWRVGTKRDVF